MALSCTSFKSRVSTASSMGFSLQVTKKEIHKKSTRVTCCVSRQQHFKDMDRKMVGRMSKWQFGALLKQ